MESGSRDILNKLVPVLWRLHRAEIEAESHGGNMEIDLVTCFAGQPEGINGRVYRVQEHNGAEGRGKLYRELASRQHTALGIVCSAEPLMTKWKWMLAARSGAKLFIINENADFFWVDRGHWRNIVQFASYRSGMTGASAIPAIGRLIFFPFTLVYLLAFAGAVHLMRALRLLRGSV